MIEGEASGTTSLYVSATGDAIINPEGILVVDTNGSSENAFIIGSSRTGLLQYALRQDGDDYYLSSLPGMAALEPVAIGNLSQDLWYQSADIYSDYSAQRSKDFGYKCGEGAAGLASCEQGTNQFGWWGQVYRAHDERGGNKHDEMFGARLDVDTKAGTERFGMQLGFDHMVSPNLIIGMTAGYERAEADIRHSESGFTASGYDLGGYLMGQWSNGFYSGLLVKYDQAKLKLAHSALANMGGDPAIKSFGLQSNIGYRFNSGNMLFDIGGGISRVSSSIDDFHAANMFFSYDKVKSLRGRFGGRVELVGRSLAPYLDLRLHHEFNGDTDLALKSGELDDGFNANGQATWGRFELGTGGNSSGKPSFAAWGEFGDVNAVGLRAGIRF